MLGHTFQWQIQSSGWERFQHYKEGIQNGNGVSKLNFYRNTGNPPGSVTAFSVITKFYKYKKFNKFYNQPSCVTVTLALGPVLT